MYVYLFSVLHAFTESFCSAYSKIILEYQIYMYVKVALPLAYFTNLTTSTMISFPSSLLKGFFFFFFLEIKTHPMAVMLDCFCGNGG